MGWYSMFIYKDKYCLKYFLMFRLSNLASDKSIVKIILNASSITILVNL